MGFLTALLDTLAPAPKKANGLVASINQQLLAAQSEPLQDVPPPPQPAAAVGVRRVLVPLEAADHPTIVNPLDGSGFPVNLSGRAIYLRRNGTPPIVELDVELGGVTRRIRPGDVIREPFTNFRVKRPSHTPYSHVAGLSNNHPLRTLAHLLVSDDANTDFTEPSGIGGPTFPPMPIYGCPAKDDPETIAENTPAVASTDGFLVTGWKRIRVYVAGVEVALESATVNPWVGVQLDNPPTNSVEWHQWSQRRVYVTSETPSIFDSHAFEMDTAGMGGRLFLEFKDVLPAGVNNLYVMAEGIE